MDDGPDGAPWRATEGPRRTSVGGVGALAIGVALALVGLARPAVASPTDVRPPPPSEDAETKPTDAAAATPTDDTATTSTDDAETTPEAAVISTPAVLAPRLLRVPPSRPRAQSPADLGLAREDDGSFVYRDPGGRFTAVFDPDGTVRFADRWRRPVASDDARASARSDRGRCCAAPPEGVGRALNPAAGIPATGPAEWAAHRGDRQAHADAKAALLRRTEAFRVRLAIAAYEQALTDRLRDLPRELDALWHAPALPWATKRALLFARWDECAEGPLPLPSGAPAPALGHLDALRLRAATRARTIIEAFAHRHARPGTAHGYPTPELERLNATRRSHAAFAAFVSEDHEPTSPRP